MEWLGVSSTGTDLFNCSVTVASDGLELVGVLLSCGSAAVNAEVAAKVLFSEETLVPEKVEWLVIASSAGSDLPSR